MNEIILVIIHTIIALIAVRVTLKGKLDKKSFIATLISIIVMTSGFYIPAQNIKELLNRRF